MMRGFLWKAPIRGLVVVKMLSKFPPVWRGIGAGTGDFDFLVKFPTRIENFRKGPAEGTREGPLSGTLSVLTVCLG